MRTNCSVLLTALLLSSSGLAEAADGLWQVDDQCAVAVVNGCESVFAGELAEGDCTSADGQYVDTIELSVTPGKLVEVILRPLDATLSNPTLALEPPEGVDATAPLLSGGAHATLSYVSSGEQKWRVRVSSRDAHARGKYLLHVDCFRDEAPELPPGCVGQELACGQTGRWSLDASVCRFADTGNRYNGWWVFGVIGDTLHFDASAASFDPLLGLFDAEQELLTLSSDAGPKRDTLTFAVPHSGWYELVAAAETSGASGEYSVTMTCSQSGCLRPYFVEPIKDVVVPEGTTATIEPAVSHHGPPLRLILYDAETHGELTTSLSGTVTTPPITGRRRFRISAMTDCGGAASNTFTVSTGGTTRRRSVRH